MQRLGDDIDERWPTMPSGSGQNLAEIGRVRNFSRFHAERFGHAGMLPARKIHSAVAFAESRLLPCLAIKTFYSVGIPAALTILVYRSISLFIYLENSSGVLASESKP